MNYIRGSGGAKPARLIAASWLLDSTALLVAIQEKRGHTEVL
jgi:hypothetical protein